MTWSTWTAWLERSRRWLGVASIVIFALAATLAVRHVRIDFSPTGLFASSDPAVEHMYDFWDRFGHDTNVVLVIVEPQTHADIYNTSTLTLVDALSTRIAAITNVVEVNSLSTAEVLRDDGGALLVEPVLRMPVTASSVGRVRRLANVSELVAPLVTPSGDATVVSARLPDGMMGHAERLPVLEQMDAILAEYADAPVVFTYIGIPNIHRTYVEYIAGYQLRVLPVVLGLLVLTLWLIFRHPAGVVVPLGAVALAATITMALIGLWGPPLDMISATIPTLLLVVGVADAIHLLERALEAQRHGEDARGGVHAATRAIGSACALTSVTTAIGFASLSVAQVDVIRNFGIWAALGILITYGVIITVVPVWLFLLPVTPAERRGRQRVGPWTAALTRWSTARPLGVMSAWMLAVALFIWAGTGIRTGSHILAELFEDDPIAQAFVKAESMGFAMESLELELTGPPEQFKRPEVIAGMAALADELEADPQVTEVLSLVDVTRELKRALDGDSGLFTDRTRFAQALFLLESSDPDVLTRAVTPDFRRARMTVRVRDSGMHAFFALTDKALALSEQYLAPLGIEAKPTGSVYVANRAIRMVVGDLARSLGAAFAFVALAIALLFRSLRIGLISMFPNVLPLLAGVALMGLMGVMLRVSSGIIFSVALGIAVDDSIHFLARMRAERRDGYGVREAAMRTAATAGTAITWTSILFVVGFSVVATSHFRGIYEFGLVVAVTLVAAWLANLTLLPAMLVKFRPFRGRSMPDSAS